MSTPVPLPALGESVTEGTITRWFKEIGEEVSEDEPLFEVSTDKVDSEVPSPAGGYLAEILEGSRDTLLAFVDRIAFVAFMPRGFADPLVPDAVHQRQPLAAVDGVGGLLGQGHVNSL